MSRAETVLNAVLGKSALDKDYEPQSRFEEICLSIINNTDYELEPQSRMEELLLELKDMIGSGGSSGGSSEDEEVLLFENTGRKKQSSFTTFALNEPITNFEYMRIEPWNYNNNNTSSVIIKVADLIKKVSKSSGDSVYALIESYDTTYYYRDLIVYDDGTYQTLATGGSAWQRGTTTNNTSACLMGRVYGIKRVSETVAQKLNAQIDKQTKLNAQSLGVSLKTYKNMSSDEVSSLTNEIAELSVIDNKGVSE